MRAVHPALEKRMKKKRLLHRLVVTRADAGPNAGLNMRNRASGASKYDLTRSKQKVDARGVPKVVFVGIVSSHETGQARQVVIRADWAESDMLADLDVKPAAHQHRKTSSVGTERGPNWR